MKCARCGTDTPRLTKDQRYCPRCEREVAVLVASHPTPTFQPEWLRRGGARDLTGQIR